MIEISSYRYIIISIRNKPVVNYQMGIAGGFESIVETKDGLGLIFDTGIQESDLNVGLERAIGLWEILCASVSCMESIEDKTFYICVHVNYQGRLGLTAAQAEKISVYGINLVFSIYASEDAE